VIVIIETLSKDFSWGVVRGWGPGKEFFNVKGWDTLKCLNYLIYSLLRKKREIKLMNKVNINEEYNCNTKLKFTC